MRHDLLTDEFFATNLYYNTSGRLWLALDQTWDVNTNGPENCQTTRCREFRYDSGRAAAAMRRRGTALDARRADRYTASWRARRHSAS